MTTTPPADQPTDHADPHPDCQVRGPHMPHALASPGGAKPGPWCNGRADRGAGHEENTK